MGSSFTNGKTDLSVTAHMAHAIIKEKGKKKTSLFLNMKKCSSMCWHVIMRNSARRERIRMIIKSNLVEQNNNVITRFPISKRLFDCGFELKEYLVSLLSTKN